VYSLKAYLINIRIIWYLTTFVSDYVLNLIISSHQSQRGDEGESFHKGRMDANDIIKLYGWYFCYSMFNSFYRGAKRIAQICLQITFRNLGKSVLFKSNQ
jgi:hypothetical protein